MANRAVQGVQQGVKQVKPLLSVDRTEARRRVMKLYKAWYREIPYTVNDYHIPITVEQGRAKVRELFLKNKHVTDVRAIDMLVIKGQMELVETHNLWKQKNHVMTYFKDTVNPKPTDFLTKFYEGQD